MSDQATGGPPVSDEGLQFEHAEVETSGPSPCSGCGQTPTQPYWRAVATRKLVCDACRRGLETLHSAPIDWSTWLRILLRGGGAALLGTLIYFAVLKITGYELGLISIFVGILVGRTVHKTAGGRGGWKLQAAAMALTYASIVSSYIPIMLQSLSKSAKASAPAVAKPADPSTASSATPPASDTATAQQPQSQVGAFLGRHPLLGLVLGVAMMFAFACAIPFLSGVGNILGLFIISFALYEAWKINRRIVLEFEGPLPVEAAMPPPSEPSQIPAA